MSESLRIIVHSRSSAQPSPQTSPQCRVVVWTVHWRCCGLLLTSRCGEWTVDSGARDRRERVRSCQCSIASVSRQRTRRIWLSRLPLLPRCMSTTGEATEHEQRRREKRGRLQWRAQQCTDPSLTYPEAALLLIQSRPSASSHSQPCFVPLSTDAPRVHVSERQCWLQRMSDQLRPDCSDLPSAPLAAPAASLDLPAPSPPQPPPHLLSPLLPPLLRNPRPISPASPRVP